MRLVEVTRDGYLESWHTGALILLDPSGAVAVSTGSVDEPVFPRSSLKPLQAVTMLEAGFAGRDASLALAAASHDGESVHLAGARATLAAAGLDETALQCPPDLPSGRAALLEWVEAGGRPAPICHNCSGKHAAMLATCVAADWPIETYRSPDHPLQQAARAGSSRCATPRSAVWRSTAAALRRSRSVCTAWLAGSRRWRQRPQGRRSRLLMPCARSRG